MNEYIYYAGMILCVFVIGYIAGRVSKAWKSQALKEDMAEIKRIANKH